MFIGLVARALFAVWGRSNSWLRGHYWKRRLGSMGEGARVANSAIIHHPGAVHLGPNSFVGDMVVIWGGGGVSIGQDSIVAAQSVITSDTHDVGAPQAGKLFRDTSVSSPILIGKNVWVGANATVLPGVNVGDGAIVAAGALVNCSVQDGAVYGGVPAGDLRR